KLQPHQAGEHAGRQKKAERRDDVSPADRLVIDGRQPAVEAGIVGPHALELRGFARRLDGGRQFARRILDGVVAPAAMRTRHRGHLSASRYASSACRSSPDRLLGGMWLPGLIDCESLIQPARWPRVLGSVAAASVPRLAT